MEKGCPSLSKVCLPAYILPLTKLPMNYLGGVLGMGVVPECVLSKMR